MNRYCQIQSIQAAGETAQLLKTAGCHIPHRKKLSLQELIYTASAIAGTWLIFSSCHYTFPSCSQIGWVEICQEKTGCSSVEPQRCTPADICGGRLSILSHYGPGCGSLCHMGRNSTRIVWAEEQFTIQHFAVTCACVSVCVGVCVSEREKYTVQVESDWL